MQTLLKKRKYIKYASFFLGKIEIDFIEFWIESLEEKNKSLTIRFQLIFQHDDKMYHHED